MQKLFQSLSKGSERTARIRRHVLISVLAKGIGMGAGLLIVPLALDYLGEGRFGIWLTITSVTGWFTFLDLGMGNGLRNRFVEAKAKGRTEEARRYVATTYFLIGSIALAIILLFLSLHPFIPWAELFNAKGLDGEGIGVRVSELVRWVVVLFFLKFAFEPVSKVVLADQRPGLNVAMRALGRLTTLLVIFILSRSSTDSLLLFGCSVQGINAMLPLLAGIILFNTRYKAYRPTPTWIDRSLSRDLIGLGFKFFVMQFAAIVVFATDHMIITRLFGPEEVPAYHIAFRYFTIALVFFRLVTNPYWSAYSDAYHRGELGWIQRATRHQIWIWIGLCAVVLLMLLLSGPIYRIWLGKGAVRIPFYLSSLMAAWILLSSFTNIFGNFLNGLGKVRLSMLHSLAFMVLNIPLSVYLASYWELGPKGVILGTLLSVLPQGILHPIQYRKIMKGTARGIWAR
ncbi:MAG: lipopolysaccharide biosynthesis protein [Flavobacteriales bacterium]